MWVEEMNSLPTSSNRLNWTWFAATRSRIRGVDLTAEENISSSHRLERSTSIWSDSPLTYEYSFDRQDAPHRIEPCGGGKSSILSCASVQNVRRLVNGSVRSCSGAKNVRFRVARESHKFRSRIGVLRKC